MNCRLTSVGREGFVELEWQFPAGLRRLLRPHGEPLMPGVGDLGVNDALLVLELGAEEA